MEIVFNSPEEILGFFSSIIPRTEGLYVWCYDIGGNLLSSTCPFEPVLDMAFEILGAKEKLSDFAKAAIAAGTAIAVNKLLGVNMPWINKQEEKRVTFVEVPVVLD